MGDSDACPHEAKIDAIHDSVRRMETLLTGNGSPDKGMVVRMAIIENYVKRAEDREQSRGKAMWAAGLSAAASVIVGAVGWFKASQ